ncbi:DUF3990 domain-containing protein [uncultured Prevotella sp.]|mgnify:FL=1|uniref:DUF3990 domain-containing protein n=1 Tax=uncultured Prevotella sp. TaxID=159272 RepID=UPI0027E32304|nr:DUF3990 domain-containing protein [uncultured Prevotella sp.]
MLTVYHGATDVVSSPICAFGRPRLDFGQGFYVTDIKEQAIRWAKTMSGKRSLPPVLNIYTLNRELILLEGKHKIFTSYDAEWLDFIVANRRGENLASEYDYIEGGIANDRVIDTVNLYIQGLIDSATALQQLAFYKPNNQICLINQSLTDKYLHYYGSERI